MQTDERSICCNSEVFTLTVFALVLNTISVRRYPITSKRQVATIKITAVLPVLCIMQQNFADLRLIDWVTGV